MSFTLVALLQVSIVTAQPSFRSYDGAYRASLTTGRSFVVLVGADWCPACHVMKESVFPQVAKAGRLKELELTYVDVDRQRPLANRLLRGGSIPQVIRYSKTPQGWVSTRLVGAKSVREVLVFLQSSGAVQADPRQIGEVEGPELNAAQAIKSAGDHGTAPTRR